MSQLPLKVLHLIQGLGIGGLEKMAVSLLNRLDRRHYRPFVCCFDVIDKLMPTLNPDTTVFFLKRREGIDMSYPFKLARLLRREKIDILHVHNSTALFYGALAGRMAGVSRIYYTEHDGGGYCSHLHRRTLNALLSRFTNGIVTVTNQLRSELIEYGNFEPHKIRVIHNGIEGQPFMRQHDRRAIRKQLGFGEDQHVLGIVARFDPVKNHLCLLQTMQIAAQHLPNTVLLVVGDGPLREKLEREVAERHLADHVRFLGTRSDIPELLSAMDLFVMSSIGEGLSITLIEAMASARPIVATRVGGNPELIADNVNGVLVPANDPMALTEAIIKLLRHPDRLGKMGEAGRRRFEEQFTVEVMVKRYQDLYENGKT